MRIVALEEHFSLPSLSGRFGLANPRRKNVADDESLPTVIRKVGGKMSDLGAGRLADMDRAGISVRSFPRRETTWGPSADMFEDDEAVAFARAFNDEDRTTDRGSSRQVRRHSHICRRAFPRRPRTSLNARSATSASKARSSAARYGRLS